MTKIGTGSLEIDTVTLDELSTNHVASDFMLIDVEGHAEAVLRGPRLYSIGISFL